MTIQEYTGLKDKNNKAIREGDIIEIDYTEEIIKIVKEDNEFYEEYLDNTREKLSITSDLDYTIIGNIYDTPSYWTDMQKDLP